MAVVGSTEPHNFAGMIEKEGFLYWTFQASDIEAVAAPGHLTGDSLSEKGANIEGRR